MSNRYKFFEDDVSLRTNSLEGSVKTDKKLNPEYLVSENEKVEETFARYRVDQLTVTTLDGLIKSHGETKREFLVKKSGSTSNLFVEVEMQDNVVKVYPDNLQETLNLLVELDLIKSTTNITVSSNTGQIEKINNHKEIIDNWKKYRVVLENKFSSFQSTDAKLNLLKYLTVVENTIVIEANLVDDLKTKLFYDLFFDQYLVRDILDLSDYERTFHSQLFEGETSILKFTQKITNENENQLQYVRVGENIQKEKGKYERLYDRKYKPMVDYKFSEYNCKFSETILLDKQGKWIEQADVLIIEEIKNNVDITVNYKLRKIE